MTRITGKPLAAEKLRRALHNGPTVADALGRAIQGPGPEPAPQGLDLLNAIRDRNDELEAEWEARRKAEAEAEATSKMTTATLLAYEISKQANNAPSGAGSSSGAMALNGPGVLRAALSSMGVSGTINEGSGNN